MHWKLIVSKLKKGSLFLLLEELDVGNQRFSQQFSTKLIRYKVKQVAEVKSHTSPKSPGYEVPQSVKTSFSNNNTTNSVTNKFYKFVN
jgi:hypothetical protein